MLAATQKYSGHPLQYSWPRKPHGRRSLVGCSPWGRKESDTTEWLHFHFSLSYIGEGNGNPLQRSCLENPRTGKPGGLPSMGSHRVGHNWSDLAAATQKYSHKGQPHAVRSGELCSHTLLLKAWTSITWEFMSNAESGTHTERMNQNLLFREVIKWFPKLMNTLILCILSLLLRIGKPARDARKFGKHR